jgi:hypothetical protein
MRRSLCSPDALVHLTGHAKGNAQASHAWRRYKWCTASVALRGKQEAVHLDQYLAETPESADWHSERVNLALRVPAPLPPVLWTMFASGN